MVVVYVMGSLIPLEAEGRVSKARKIWVEGHGSGLVICIYGVLEGGRDVQKWPGSSLYRNTVTSLVIAPPPSQTLEPLDHFSVLTAIAV